MAASLMDQAEYRRTLRSSMALPLSVLILLILIAFWQVGALLTAAHWVDHSDEVIAQADLALKQILDMEVGERSYLITGRPAALQPYRDSGAKVDATLTQLQQLTSDNPSQKQRITEIRASYQEIADQLRRTLVLFDHGMSYRAAFDTGRGKHLTTTLRSQFDVFIGAERKLRRERRENVQKMVRTTFGVAVIMVLLFAASLALSTRRQQATLYGNYERSLTVVQAHAEEVRQKAEALAKSEEFLATTLRSIGDGVIATDAEGRVNFLNTVAETLTGWKSSEANGEKLEEVFNIINQETRQKVESPTVRVLREGVIVGLANHTLLIDRQGRERPIDDSAAPIRTAQGAIIGTILVFRDVSERKLLEEQLLQAQKMESIGRLAGGVAHDFNNMLTAITGYAELAMESVTDETIRTYLDNVRMAAERSASLTRQLLAFARKQVISPRLVDLNELTSHVDKLLRHLLGENIETTLAPQPGLYPVRVDPGQIEQCLINLTVNSRDAMPHGGKLIIETANVVLDREYAEMHPEVTSGEYVMLAVSDTGIGMTEEVRQHLFEPFYTTKGVGEGTGLGLAMCYGIVKQAGGHIWVYSEPGKGTTFKIYLPAVRDEIDGKPEETIRLPLPHGSETILVAEDELLVRNMIVKVLTDQGYMVLQARDGVEGWHAFEKREGPIHLLLTDVVMPQMGGIDLAEKIAEQDSACKILFISGYTGGVLSLTNQPIPRFEFLQKPFTPLLLAQKVREILDTP